MKHYSIFINGQWAQGAQANAMLLAATMQSNAPACIEPFARLAGAMGLHLATPEALLAELESLRKDLEIPTSLAELGVTKDELPAMARDAAAIERLIAPTPPAGDTRRRRGDLLLDLLNAHGERGPEGPDGGPGFSRRGSTSSSNRPSRSGLVSTVQPNWPMRGSRPGRHASRQISMGQL